MTLSILLIIAIGFLLRAYIFKKVKYRNLHSFMIAFFINCLFYYLLPAIYFASDLYIYSTQNDWSGGMTIMLTIDYLTSILLYIFVGLYLTIGVCWILKLQINRWILILGLTIGIFMTLTMAYIESTSTFFRMSPTFWFI